LQKIPFRLVIYGHIEYTDIFPNPKPTYVSGFCGGIASDQYGTADQNVCAGRQHIR
jgi:hypothetical protein